ncbi:MAG: cyclic nucleotide-binding domain-containing protein [Panacagrimonas sp.]
MLNKPVVQQFVEFSRKRGFPPKHIILKAGDEPRSLFLIIEGSVSVLAQDGDREIVLAYLGAGDFFGEMCLFPEQSSRTAIVRSRSPVLVAEVEFAAFREFVRRYPEIMFDVAGQLAMRLRDTTRRLRDLTFVDVAGRLAHQLMSLCEDPDAKTHARGTLISISRQELARIIGCSREMVGRVLKKLEEDGLIASRGRSILVLKPG